MATAQRALRNLYRDSVSLMKFSEKISALPGVAKASAVMATPNNINLLQEAGLSVGTVSAGPNDLLIVVEGGDDRALEAALTEAEALLKQKPATADGGGPQRTAPRSIEMGVAETRGANFALISTPGDYAAAEALKALHLGLHVMMFSGNVSLEDEILLKQYGREHGLLVMGPDCGTAIINGVPLGFANVVQRGDVGIVAASGTGLQQVSSLVDRWGAGISQAIGIGSHDLHARVGGISMLMGNEGLGKVLRFGANHPAVIERLNWMRDVLGPALSATLKALGAVELKPIIAQALHMGDECHNRNAAASGLLFKRLAPALIKTEVPRSDVSSVLSFVGGNDHFFLNISMAACKASLDAAHGVPGSSLVTVMARNGVDFGIRTSGTGDQWFTAPAPMVNGLYFTGYGPADAAPDLGDSAITETAGIGGFAMGAAPAIVQFVGGTPEDAIGYTREMYHITLGHNSAFTLPPLSFIGSPAGIDARKVADRRIAPVINTGIAHREAGVGQVGAGITRAPLACFDQAVSALAHRVGRGQAGGKEAPVTDSDLTPRFAFSRNQKTPR